MVSVTHARCPHSTLKLLGNALPPPRPAQSAGCYLQVLGLPVGQNFILLHLSLPDLPLVLICASLSLCTQKKMSPLLVPRSPQGILKRSDSWPETQTTKNSRSKEQASHVWKQSSLWFCSLQKNNHISTSGREKLIPIK